MGVTPTTAKRGGVAAFMFAARKTARWAPLASSTEDQGPRTCTSSVSGWKTTRTHISRYHLLFKLLGTQCPVSLPSPRPDIAHFSVRTVSTCPRDWDVGKEVIRFG